MSKVCRWPAAAGAIAKHLTHMSRTLQTVCRSTRSMLASTIAGVSPGSSEDGPSRSAKNQGTFTGQQRPIRPVAPRPVAQDRRLPHFPG